MVSHREGDKKSLSWKTLLLWLLLIRKEEYMHLKVLTVGPLHMLQSPFCLSQMNYQCPVLAWLCLQRALLSFLHTCPESGCWMQMGQILSGDLHTCPLSEEGPGPISFHRVQMQVSVTTFVTRGRVGK